MYYSLVGLLALIILLITNHDVFFARKGKWPSFETKHYRNFLFGVLLYYITDIVWGILWEYKLITPLFVDTEVYFIAMSVGIFFLTQYTVAYLRLKSFASLFLRIVGIVFFAGVTLLVFLNAFFPVLFYFNEADEYVPCVARYIVLGFQIIMLVLVSIFAFIGVLKAKGLARTRYLMIVLFGLIMVSSIGVQMYFPLLPLYSIGYLLGCALIRTFIIDNEKKEHRLDLEDALAREQKQSQELKRAWELAYSDALTGAKSKLAYLEKEEEIDNAIADGKIEKLAIVIFDINDLKIVNDTQGHAAGDRYIIDACALISECFENSPIFRLGGDEFLVVLEGEEYDHRKEKLALFDAKVEYNIENGGAIVSSGMADFIPDSDRSFRHISEKADFLMYQHKEALKKRTGSSNN